VKSVGIVPVALINQLSMLSDYIDPAERLVACPTQDVVYGAGSGETKWVMPEKFFDELPALLQDAKPLQGEEARYAQMAALAAIAKADPHVTFAKGQLPPVKGFWSLTLYNEQHFFSPNDLKRYSIGTKNKSLQANTSGRCRR
jgi:hypothetical protein